MYILKPHIYFYWIIFSILFWDHSYSQTESTYLDQSFGNGKGWITEGIISQPRAIVEDTINGQILVAGTIQTGADRHMIIRSYLYDGSPNPQWGTNGQVIIDFGYPAWANAIAFQNTGISQAIFVAGYIEKGVEEWAIAKLDPAGNPDNTFNNTGLLTLNVGPSGIANDIISSPEGGIWVGGETGFDIAVAKINQFGILDPFFGNNGIVTIDVGVQDFGGYLAGGGDNDYDDVVISFTASQGGEKSIFLARMDEFGTRDQNFGTNGLFQVSLNNKDIGLDLDMDLNYPRLGFAAMDYERRNFHFWALNLEADTLEQGSGGGFNFGKPAYLAGIETQDDGSLMLGVKNLYSLDSLETLFLFRVTGGNGNLGNDTNFGNFGWADIGIKTYFHEPAFNNTISFFQQQDGKFLFATTVDTLTGPKWLLVRAGDERLIQPPPLVSDSSLTFSLNHGNHDARLVFPIDMDSDGDLDIVTHDSDSLFWVEQVFNVDGSRRSFFNPHWNAIMPLPNQLIDLDTADLNQDGIPEFLIACETEFLAYPQTDVFLLNNIIAILIGKYKELCTGDIDGDGLTDVLAIKESGDSLVVLKNLGNNQFQKSTLPTNGASIKILELNDLDNDGDLDLMVGGDATVAGGSNIWYNNGMGNFSIGTFLGPGATSDFHVADIDDDGYKEVLYYDFLGPSPDLWALEIKDPVGTSEFLVENVTGSSWFDDVDGIPGLEALMFNKTERVLYFSKNLDLLTTNTTEYFWYYPHTNIEFSGGVNPESADFFFGNWSNNLQQMQLYYQNFPMSEEDYILGRQTFATHPMDLSDLDLADLDGDGDLDIVATDPGPISNPLDGSHLLIYENIDGYLFSSIEHNFPRFELSTVSTADVNSDGKEEILTWVPDSNFLDILLAENIETNLINYYRSNGIGFPGFNLFTEDYNQDGTAEAYLVIPDSGKMWYTPNLEMGFSFHPDPETVEIPIPTSTTDAVAIYHTDSMDYFALLSPDSHPFEFFQIDFNNGLNVPFTSNLAQLLPDKVAKDVRFLDINKDELPDIIMSLVDSGSNNPFNRELVLGIQIQPGQFILNSITTYNSTVSPIEVFDQAPSNKVLVFGENQPGKTPRLGIWVNNSDHGDFGIQYVELPEAGSIDKLKIGDLNGDEYPDIVVLDKTTGNIWVNLMGFWPEDSTGGITSIPISQEEHKLIIHPNPTDKLLHVKLSGATINEVTIFNPDGQAILSNPVFRSQNRIDLSALPEGIYIIRVDASDGNRYWKRVLKQ